MILLKLKIDFLNTKFNFCRVNPLQLSIANFHPNKDTASLLDEVV
jgi:hypothetical protein